jgi:uncharacterized protein with beta-barrel porin domain
LGWIAGFCFLFAASWPYVAFASEDVDLSGGDTTIGGNNQVGIYGTSSGAVVITTTGAVSADTDDVSGIELGYNYGGSAASNIDISAGILTLNIDHNITGKDTQGEGITNNTSAVFDMSGGLVIDIANGVTVSSGNSGGTTSGFATGAIYLSSGSSGTVGGAVSITNAGTIVSGQGGDNGSAYTPAAIELGAASNSLVESVTIVNSGDITGGLGGVDVSSGGNNGSGGISVNYTSSASSISNTGNVTGGAGEVDGDTNGPGGDGGFGISIGNVAGGFTINNTGAGVVSGGDGHDGSANSSSGIGGDGGSGIIISGSGSFTINNENSVTGGAGANGAVKNSTNLTAAGGGGGYGVNISGTTGLTDVITINNAAGATISSGAAGTAAADGSGTIDGTDGSSGIYIGSTATVNIANASGASVTRGVGGAGAGGGDAGADGYALELASSAVVNVDNDGTLTGGISLSGGGTIRVQGSSTVGDIIMNGGSAYIGYDENGDVASDGTTSSITGGTGSDSVYISTNGIVTGNIDVSSGDNTLAFTGSGATIGGSVTATTGDDTIEVSADTTIAGSFDLGAGANGISVTNGATLTLDSSIASSGTLDLSIDGELAQNTADDLEFVNLTVASGETGALSGTGAGDILITGIATINGDLLINRTSDIMTISSTGSLKGTGSIDSGIIINGTHSPGNSIGTQGITGNVTYNSGSVIEVELDNDGNHDQINITGNLTINNGATFKGVGVGGTVSNSLTLDIMTYTGALTVDGSVVTDESFAFDTSYLDTAVLDFTLSHSATDDTIYMIVNPSDFNPESVISHTDGLTLALDNINAAGASGEMASLITRLQSIVTDSELHQAFTELSPVQLNTSPAAVVAATQSIGDVISGHIGKVTAGVTNQGLSSEKVASMNSGVLLNVDQSIVIEQKKWTPFIEFVVSKGDQDDKDGIAGYKLDNSGFIIGTDYLVSDKFLVGLSGSYMQPSMNSNDDLVSIDIETWQANIYSSYFFRNFHIDAHAGYGWSEIDSERQINFMGTTAEADHDAEYLSLGAGAGYRLDVYKKLIVEPFCELNYVNMDEDGYEESGAGGANLKIDSTNVESFKSGFGIRLAKLFNLQNGLSVKPEISYRWEHEFKDDAVSNSASFVSAGSSFTTEGIKPDANHHIFGAGIKAFMGRQLNLYLNYECDRSDSYRSHNGLVGIEINF